MTEQTHERIAEALGTTRSNVASSLTRSMQYMKRYFKHEIEVWNRVR